MITDGNTFLGIQGHPELSKTYCASRIKVRRNEMPAEVVAAGLKSLEREPDSPEVIKWISRFIRNDK